MLPKLFFVLVFFFFFSSCNHGLEPYKETAGFGGVITFQHWPQPDTLVTLHLLASKVAPPFGDINSILQLYGLQQLYFIPTDLTASFPMDTPSISYKFLLPSGTYYYIALVAQVSPMVSTSNFKVIGLLTQNTTTFEPEKLIVPLNTFVPNKNIIIDFEHLPPQPFDSTAAHQKKRVK